MTGAIFPGASGGVGHVGIIGMVCITCCFLRHRTEVGTLVERLRIDVGLLGRLFDVGPWASASLRKRWARSRSVGFAVFDVSRDLRASLRASAASSSRALTTVARLTPAISATVVSVASGLALSAALGESGQSFKLTFGSSALLGWPTSNKRQLVKEPTKLSGVD